MLVLLGECKAKEKTYHYQIRDSEAEASASATSASECRSIEGKGRRNYPIVRSRGVRGVGRRPRRRSASAASGGVAGRAGAWRMQDALGSSGQREAATDE